MTQEDKQFLLADLCAKLPYNVIVDYCYNVFDVHKGNYVKHGSKCILTCYLLDTFISPRQNEKGEYIKPYLRSMSSMTEEEIIDFLQVTDLSKVSEKLIYNFKSAIFGMMANMSNYARNIDWLNVHHFDYRGLIPKGLAIEVTEENNPYHEIVL